MQGADAGRRKGCKQDFVAEGGLPLIPQHRLGLNDKSKDNRLYVSKEITSSWASLTVWTDICAIIHVPAGPSAAAAIRHAFGGIVAQTV